MRLRLTLAATVLGMAAASAPTATAAPTLFPSDRLTVKDSRQATGKRVNLPVTDCKQRPTDCDELRLINRLDGFDLDPRVELDLGRRIDPKRVTRRAAYLRKVAGGRGSASSGWSTVLGARCSTAIRPCSSRRRRGTGWSSRPR